MSVEVITTREYTCDRCGYVDRSDGGWLRRKNVDLCPGCNVDLLSFMCNLPVAPNGDGEAYRHANPAVRQELHGRLVAKGFDPASVTPARLAAEEAS